MDAIRVAQAPTDEIRRPLVIAAAVLIVIAFAIELGSRLWIGQGVALAPDTPRPGLGIPSMAALDALLLMSLAAAAASALGVSANVLARGSGCITVIVSFLTLLASLILVFVTIGLLLLMVGLLFAAPFGTAVYMAVYGSFKRGPAAVTLGILMTLKLVAALVAFLGNQNIIKSKSLILMFASSIVLTFLVSLLHGLVPGFLVSITDAIAAIIAYIFAIVWAIIYLVGGIIGFLGNLKLAGKKPR